MATTYRNPVNGYEETVSSASSFWAFFFGVFWFAVKGLWGHVVIQLLLGAVLLGSLGGPGFMLYLVVNAIYCALAPSILEKSYLRRGWVEVGVASSQPEQAPATTKKCPYCAEEILVDAIKCKHCGSALSDPSSAQVAGQN